MKKVLHIIAGIFTFVIAVISSITAPFTLSVKADISDSNLEDTYISEDLGDIDITQYPKDEKGYYQVIRFQEYCYSEKPFYSQYYGLYFYLYNPTEREIIVDKTTVNMAVKYNSNGEPSSYEKLSLKLCDKTANNRFYKFKILNSMNDTTLLKTAQEYASKHDGKRRYDIASVEVYHTDGSSNVNAVDGKFAQTYYYSGYAASCGESNTSTLSATVEPMATLDLKPHATTYRPEGHNSTSDYTQDSLHSVWFSVPNDFIEQYGALTAVKATWLNAVLKPCLITGNEEAYNAILPYLGVELPYDGEWYYDEDLIYSYVSDYIEVENILNTYTFGWAYNYSKLRATDIINRIDNYDKDITNLYLLFPTDTFAEDSADNYILSSTKILQKALEISKTLDGEKIVGANGSYSKAIFESIDDKYTTLNVTDEINDDFDFESTVLGSSWWEKLLGKEYTTPFDGIRGLEAVTAKHIALSDSELSSTLYISPTDIDDLRAEYNAKSSSETIYVLRYMVSEYTAKEATLLERHDSILGVSVWNKIDTNARFFQETVNLNFDIIQVTCTKEEVETIIPVVSNPIDIFPESTPALDTTSDKESEWWEKIIALLLVVLLVAIFMPFLAPIISTIFTLIITGVVNILKFALKIVIFVLALPLRLIGWIFKKK